MGDVAQVASAVTERTGRGWPTATRRVRGDVPIRPCQRHGVLNGLPAAGGEAQQTAHPEAHPPVAGPRPATPTSAWNRAVKDNGRDPAWATASSASASATEMASAPPAAGACQRPRADGDRDLRPVALRHDRACRPGTPGGRDGPWRGSWPPGLRGAGVGPQTAANSMPSVEASAGACVIRAQWPVPTRPNLKDWVIQCPSSRASVPVVNDGSDRSGSRVRRCSRSATCTSACRRVRGP
jgi:hypothetical protein